MSHEATISTVDALRSLGFQHDPRVISDECPGLSFDFGNLALRASNCLNLRCVEVVLFSGVLSTSCSLAEVFFEMPRKVKSLKQCAAWIVWSLDQCSEHRVFKPARHVGWIEEARTNQRLLPWVMSMAEFSARPQCLVRRDWLRLALKTLDEYLVSLSGSTGIVFSFDGSVLTIQFDKKVIALAGEGPPWAVRFKVEAKALSRLPKRLMRAHVVVSIWESRIAFDGHSYTGTLEESEADQLRAKN